MWPGSKEAARRQKFRTVCDAMLDLLKNPDHWKATRSREERYTFSVEFDFSPSYNIAPTQEVLTIGRHAKASARASAKWVAGRANP